MRLRPLDKDDRDAYLREILPRLLTVRLKAGRVDLRWLVPSWALEEPLRFLLRVASLAGAVAPERARWLAAAVRLPLGARWTPPPSHAATSRTGTSRTGTSRTGAPRTGEPRTGPARWWPAADAFFSEADRDLLALPDGVPLVDVQAGDARIVVAEIRP